MQRLQASFSCHMISLSKKLSRCENIHVDCGLNTLFLWRCHLKLTARERTQNVNVLHHCLINLSLSMLYSLNT